MKKLTVFTKLNGHEGCVNAIEFNSTGDIVVSGSDDRDVIFWDWQASSKKLSYASGHLDNIFQTKIMPYTDDCRIVTSAGDGQVTLAVVLFLGFIFVDLTMLSILAHTDIQFLIFQVRLGQVYGDGQVHTKRLGKHQGRVYKLAVEPGSPYIFYSCGEDGFVQHVSHIDDIMLILLVSSFFNFKILLLVISSFYFAV